MNALRGRPSAHFIVSLSMYLVQADTVWEMTDLKE